MNSTTKNYLILGQCIVILILIMVLRGGCSRQDCRDHTYAVIQIDSFFKDTGTHTLVLKKQPVPYKVEVMVPIPQWMHDTVPDDYRDSIYNAIATDYYSKKYYRDSLNDSNINIIWNFSINENKPANMQINYRWKKPIKQITYLPEPKVKNSLWLSHQVTIWEKLYLGTELGCVVKNRTSYSIGCNLPITGSYKMAYFRYGYRLF